jgi:amino acid transporter
MLSFISFWRAAAIVLSDLGSTAYYIGGIAEQAIGKAAPWFILAIMLFSYAIRAVYIESCGMFVRGGVYRIVNEAMGKRMAKFAVSALMFDYILTGPISSVSAGLYLSGLLNELGEYLHIPELHFSPAFFSIIFAIGVTLYFWRKNVIGMHESSIKALRIMQITTVMVVLLIGWCLITIIKQGFFPVPVPLPENLHFSSHSLGWLEGTFLPSIPLIAIMIGLGHSLLAMSGEESLAQVNRDIAHPKLKNLEKTGLVIFIYSLVFTSLVSFFAIMIIPDSERPRYLDNLIGGLSMFLVGPLALKLIFHAFVVLVGVLILSGAVNTSIIGSNGVLNRVAEDGVLTDWFRYPHKKFGTTARLINLITILQLITILASGGNVYILGEAYAFGVIWSFTMMAISMLILRYKIPTKREWRVPLNIRIGEREIPVGLAIIAGALLFLALINLVTKQTATISGLVFTALFFTLFELSSYYNKIKAQDLDEKKEKFRLEEYENVALESIQVRPGNVLVAVRNPNRLEHLLKVIEKTDMQRMDIVVLTVRAATEGGSQETGLGVHEIVSSQELDVFSNAVHLAEKAGKHVDLLVVPASDPYAAMVRTAAALQSSRIVIGTSNRMNQWEMSRLIGVEWEKIPSPRPSLSLEIVPTDKVTKSIYVNLGPHPPRLWPEDVDRLHKLWLTLTENRFGARLHHRDIIGVALRRIEREVVKNPDGEAMNELEREVFSRGKSGQNRFIEDSQEPTTKEEKTDAKLE